MSSNNSIFSGSSRYANDFAQIITRAVALASLPVSQLNNQKNALNAKSAALKSLQDQFSTLGSSVTNIGAALGQKALQTTVSDSTVAKPTVNADALPGAYTIQVLSAGSKTHALTKEGLPVVSDPYATSISAAASFTLTVNGVNTVITPAANSLAELAKAINGAAAGVTANVINIGGNASPDYRLTLQSIKLGATSVSLQDDTQELLDTLATGTLASYTVNGLPAQPIETDSRTATIGMGVTIDILRAGSTEITVERNSEPVADALASFVTAFNAAVTELDKHRGSAAGALNGDPLLFTMTQELRTLVGYEADSGSLLRLDDIGLSLDKFGRLQMDRTKLESVSAAGAEAILSFLGSEATSGFLNNAAEAFSRLQNSDTGFFPSALAKLNTAINRQSDLIAENQKRVELMRETLSQKMAAADAMIAGLEQQINLFNGIFEAQLNARK